MTSKHILLIAPHGSYRTPAYLRAAEELGFRVTLASESQHSIVSRYQSGWHIDFSNIDAAVHQLVHLAQDDDIGAIIATDDFSVEIVSRTAQALGLSHNPPDAVRFTRRKDLARQCLQHAGLAVPPFQIIDLRKDLNAQLARFDFPGVLKPVHLSGSLGVMRVNNRQACLAACARIENIIKNQAALCAEEACLLLLEQYIPGIEIAVEGMLTPGGFELICIFDKPDPLEGPFFEESYYITPSTLAPKLQDQAVQLIEHSCRAYGLQQGAIHAECRINGQGVWLLEIASRTIGGMCASLFEMEDGISLEKRVLANALQQPLTSAASVDARGVLMIPIPKAGVLKGITGLQSARNINYITDLDIQIRPGHILTPLPEGSSYLGFIFARGPTALDVEKALRQAHQTLNFKIHPLWTPQQHDNERQNAISTG